MNGAVERCNGAWRHEFYETYDLPASVNELNPILQSYQHLYNTIGPTAHLPEKPSPVSRPPLGRETSAVSYVLRPYNHLTLHRDNP